MIIITLNDGTKINYNTFDEIVDYCKHQIIKLDCIRNNLTELPDIISSMTNLQELYCNKNKLTELPDFICQLTNLTHLSCSYNELTFLPRSIGNLNNLECLSCFNNNLIKLPDSICNLTNLKELVFFNTNINTLPDSIINLRNIIIIDDIEYKTPQQQRYYNWIESGKADEFNEYYDEFLIKSVLKCS